MLDKLEGEQEGSMKIWARLSLAILSGLMVLSTSPSVLATPASAARQVLIIHSYHAGLSWTESVMDGIREALRQKHDEVQISAEFLDARRYPGHEHARQIREVIVAKLQRLAPDLVIAADNAALEFVLALREQLLAQVPIVFCGINSFTPSMIADHRQITGVAEDVSVAETVALALRLHPGTRELIVLGRTSVPADKANRDSFAAALPALPTQLKISFWDDLPLPELQARLVGLKEGAVVFLNGLLEEESGRQLMYGETTAWVCRHSAAPVYSLWDVYLGYGIVGGKLISGYRQGQLAGEMARRILLGESADALPVVNALDANRYIFDFHQLERLSIPLNELPEGAEVVNRPYSFYQQYKTLAWATAALVLVLSSLVVLLSLTVVRRRAAVEALRQNEGVLRSLLEATPAGVALLVDRVFQRVNPALCKMTGYLEREIVGMKTRVLYPDEETYSRVGWELYENMTKSGLGVLETRLKRKDGELIEALLCLSPFDPTDASKGVTATVLDITERKQAEEETRRLRNYLSNIINSMPSVLVGVDVNGCVTQWNAAAEKATGIEMAQARGQSLDRVLPMMHRQLDQLRQAMRTRTVLTWAKVPRIVDGELRYEDVTVYPLISNDLEGAVIRVDDVTERVRIEEMMVQSEKMLSVGGLAAGMAHEINNPLGVILQACQNILRRCSPDLPANKRVAEECGANLSVLRQYLQRREILTFLEDIRQSGQRAAEIVANMLSFSRKAEGTGTAVDLGDLLERTVALAASDYDLKKHYDFRQIEIVREYQPGTPRIVCQAGKIQQVFLNILRNGAQAMRTGEGTGRAPRFMLRVRPDDAMVRVEIEDNGPGMDEATRKRVFEPFFTTKPPGSGTGLGLSVSYFIITEDHGGMMTVESSPGVGTRFIIRLPAAKDAV